MERFVNFLAHRKVEVIEITEKTYKLNEKLLEEYEVEGLDFFDSLIASCCIEKRCPLYTRNIRHFDFIENLTVKKPY